jgi:hypothetical protein
VRFGRAEDEEEGGDGCSEVDDVCLVGFDSVVGEEGFLKERKGWERVKGRRGGEEREEGSRERRREGEGRRWGRDESGKVAWHRQERTAVGVEERERELEKGEETDGLHLSTRSANETKIDLRKPLYSRRRRDGCKVTRR